MVSEIQLLPGMCHCVLSGSEWIRILVIYLFIYFPHESMEQSWRQEIIGQNVTWCGRMAAYRSWSTNLAPLLRGLVSMSAIFTPSSYTRPAGEAHWSLTWTIITVGCAFFLSLKDGAYQKQHGWLPPDVRCLVRCFSPWLDPGFSPALVSLISASVLCCLEKSQAEVL